MKNAARMALVAAAAYPLGRYHKLRWALMLAAFGATGRLESPGRFALRGVKELANTPELSELTETVQGQLLDAARSAAISAATSSIGSLTDRLNDQTEALRKPASDVTEGVSKAAGRSSAGDDEDEVDQTEETDADESVDEKRPRRRQPESAGQRTSRDQRDDGPASKRRQAEDSDNGQGESRRQRRPARSKQDGGGSPVRRRG
ncbi:MAG TPA: hypothetical protein VG476_06115 [Acidimicrobiales bacterium]|nr:hypothetical protein [Acidimicrobiales bacterium]